MGVRATARDLRRFVRRATVVERVELTMLAIAEPSSVMVWADRVRAEYEDLPGLSLTRDQMVRLFSVDARTCDELLEMLTVACILRKTPQGTYVGWHSAY